MNKARFEYFISSLDELKDNNNLNEFNRLVQDYLGLDLQFFIHDNEVDCFINAIRKIYDNKDCNKHWNKTSLAKEIKGKTNKVKQNASEKALKIYEVLGQKKIHDKMASLKGNLKITLDDLSKQYEHLVDMIITKCDEFFKLEIRELFDENQHLTYKLQRLESKNCQLTTEVNDKTNDIKQLQEYYDKAINEKDEQIHNLHVSISNLNESIRLMRKNTAVTPL